MKRHEEALAAYEAALRLNPNNPHACWGRRITPLYLTCYAEALASFEEGLRLDPKNALLCEGKDIALDFLK